MDPSQAATQRQILVGEYQAAFLDVENARYADAIVKLQKLDQDIMYWIRDPNQTALSILINDQIGKPAGL